MNSYTRPYNGQWESFELHPYVGYRDKKLEARNRLKRLKARQWMRERGIHQLGREVDDAKREEFFKKFGND